MTALDPRAILALLTKDAVLRVLAALALDEAEEAAIARLSKLPEARVRRALATLHGAGLAERTESRWHLRREAFGEALRAASAKPAGGEPDEIRAFFRDGRLREMPAQKAKRVAVLRHVAERFAPGREYTENEVNTALGAVDNDFASLRRYLIDEGLLTRDHGVYRRA